VFHIEVATFLFLIAAAAAAAGVLSVGSSR
jgi:hypothetical protein